MSLAGIRRAQAFADRFGLRIPILMAPMAGACPPALARAVCDAGGMGALGALLLDGKAMAHWVKSVREHGEAALQINLWIPDRAPDRDSVHEHQIATWLASFSPAVDASVIDVGLIDFDAQCEALIAARPAVASSIMGLFPSSVVARLKSSGIAWFATVTTVAEARAAAAAGADAIVAQGAEAGGHRGSFEPAQADQRAAGLFALLPQVVDAVTVPVIAAGGIADARGIAAALALGASAVQIGTGLLRCPEANIAPAWADAIGASEPDGTRLTRAFSGRWGRAIANDYVRAAATGPEPAPYPIQRALTAPMRAVASRDNDLSRMQAWAGQGGALAVAQPASLLLARLWREATMI